MKLKVAAIERRNDIGANSLNDLDTARRVGAKAKDAGLEVRCVNALYPFNIWSDDLARRAESYQRPHEMTVAQSRLVIEATLSLSLAKNIQASQALLTISSQVSKTVLARLSPRRYCQIFSTGLSSGE